MDTFDWMAAKIIDICHFGRSFQRRNANDIIEMKQTSASVLSEKSGFCVCVVQSAIDLCGDYSN
jgi:hypothetical protein